MQSIFAVDKPAGLTPLETLELIRKNYPAYRQAKLAYVGRLDPLAEGVMVVAADEATRRPAELWGWNKEYQVEVLLGAATDTGDIMGLVKDMTLTTITKADINQVAKRLIGSHRQTAPAFSAPGLAGKTFVKTIEIFNLITDQSKSISAKTLLADIDYRLSQVNGQFRQAEILAAWRQKLTDQSVKFQLIPMTINCSAGTYIRVLAETFGRQFKLPALAYKIKRTRAGEFGLDQVLTLPRV